MMDMEIRERKVMGGALPGQATWIFSTFGSSVPELQMIIQLEDTVIRLFPQTLRKLW